MKIVVTGAGGFIGSCLSHFLSSNGHEVIAVDDFTQENKRSLAGPQMDDALVSRDTFFDWLEEHHTSVDRLVHLGARTDTAEMDVDLFNRLNLDYSKTVWKACVSYNIPLVYASSAATYGDGEHGFEDDHKKISSLAPLNPYGQSKQDFDLWVLEQKVTPPHWSGFKFFNIYGPNEDFKGRMASVIFHTFNTIKKTGGMKLFKSHKEGIKDGHQSRDFVYVKDLVKVLDHFIQMQDGEYNGIYNLGTGQARTFLDLARNTFTAQDLEPNISFIDTPIDIRDKYQYFTEATIDKLRAAGYKDPFYTLEEGIKDYVQNYLLLNKNY